MRIYYDTEFTERGFYYPIELISIGIVREDGREYYAVAADGWDPAHANDWVKQNVLPHLGRVPPKPRSQIATDIAAFVGETPEFFADYCAYDHVALCQLYGRMIDLPKGWPMFTNDLQQILHRLGNPTMPPLQGTAHNALDDARHLKLMHEHCMKLDAWELAQLTRG